ncbi:MAG: signal peptidase II [Balneolaceae bacterium]|nr:signal peptidase II [Balneolaceae bacterium]
MTEDAPTTTTSPSKGKRPFRLGWFLAPIFVVIAIDQLTKWWVRHDPSLHALEIIPGWFRFTYTLNPGMALGIEWLPTPVVGTLSTAATIGILYYVGRNVSKAPKAFLIAMGFVTGGAIGNIIDRMFLGLVEGYGGFMEGHVVDFLHFSLRIQDFSVFPYIFNVADIAISVSVITMLIFRNRILPPEPESEISDYESSVSESSVSESSA